MRFGIAVRDITPQFPITMHGYGSRADVFDAVNDPLTFTAVVIEEGNHRALLAAADLCTFHNDGTVTALMDRLAQAIGCARDNVMLNASHTHGGPHILGASFNHKKNRHLDASRRYQQWVNEQFVAAASEAAGSMVEGTLWFGEGKTDLPMNRRPDRDGGVPNAPNPGGPVDNRLQLLVFRDAHGETAAVGMRVSCHAVATGDQHLITAGYPGAWRAEFSRAFGPKVTPFFLQGAGADARPRQAADGDRWRCVRHGELPEIGRGLLNETLAVLTGAHLKPVENLILEGKINDAVAHCEKRHTRRDDFEALLTGEGRSETARKRRDPFGPDANKQERAYAQACLEILDAGEEIPDNVTFMVQTLWLNADFALIAVDAEPLCALGRHVESAVSPAQAIFLGYTNGTICYVPDTAEMKRGGYETISYLYEPWTGPLLPGLENIFADAVQNRPGQ